MILIVQDLQPFVADRTWLSDFGEVLVVYWDAVQPDPLYGIKQSGNVTQYADGLKIDFTLWPVDLFQQIMAAPAFDAELDAGYRVLLDKDGLTADLRPAYRPGLSAHATLPRRLSDLCQRFFDRRALCCQMSLAR